VVQRFSGRGWGRALEGLPTTFVRDLERDGREVRSGVESLLAERHPIELSNLGFIPLEQHKSTDFAVFFATQPCRKPKIYLNNSANAESRLSNQLQYILTGSRFMHYLRAIMDSTEFTSRAAYERILNTWIKQQYVHQGDTVSLETEVRLPLREASITVSDVPDKPGVYRVVAFLRPTFQLDALSTALRFAADVVVRPGRR
jgi:type VI secretion system protein ImpC